MIEFDPRVAVNFTSCFVEIFFVVAYFAQIAGDDEMTTLSVHYTVNAPPQAHVDIDEFK